MYGFASQVAVYERRGSWEGAMLARVQPVGPHHLCSYPGSQRPGWVLSPGAGTYPGGLQSTSVPAPEGQKSQPGWHGHKTTRFGEGGFPAAFLETEPGLAWRAEMLGAGGKRRRRRQRRAGCPARSGTWPLSHLEEICSAFPGGGGCRRPGSAPCRSPRCRARRWG